MQTLEEPTISSTMDINNIALGSMEDRACIMLGMLVEHLIGGSLAPGHCMSHLFMKDIRNNKDQQAWSLYVASSL